MEIKNSLKFKPVGKFNKKSQIVLTHTSRVLSEYFKSLEYRYNGNYTKIPHYVISRIGDIYQLLPPNTYSDYMINQTQNKRVIIVSLENLGWLKKNSLNNDYVNWIGNIYKQEVFEKKWRDYIFWQPYTDNQMISLSKLILKLCEEFNIPTTSFGHNVKVEGVTTFNGIATLSNYDGNKTCLSPAFNFDEFIKKIENEQPA